MGTICGLVGTAFHICVEYATGFRENNHMIIYFLPLAGIVIVFIYRICGIRHSKGTNLVIGSIRSVEDEIPSRMAPLIFISTVITHLFGGSSGREGAALQIGGSIGVSIGKLFKLDDSDKHILTLCGMSAVFSALFGTPITAALFSMEVISIGILYYCAFVPCLFSSVIAYAITKKLHVVHDHYNIAGMPTSMDVPLVIKVIGLAILCAVLSSAQAFPQIFQEPVCARIRRRRDARPAQHNTQHHRLQRNRYEHHRPGAQRRGKTNGFPSQGAVHRHNNRLWIPRR